MDNIENLNVDNLDFGLDYDENTVVKTGEDDYYNRVKTTEVKISKWKKVRAFFMRKRIIKKADKYMERVNESNVNIYSTDLSRRLAEYNFKILGIPESADIIQARTIKLAEQMLNGAKQNANELLKDEFRTANSFGAMDQESINEFKRQAEEYARNEEAQTNEEPVAETPVEEEAQTVTPIAEENEEKKYVEDEIDKRIILKMNDRERRMNGIGDNFEIIDQEKYNNFSLIANQSADYYKNLGLKEGYAQANSAMEAALKQQNEDMNKDEEKIEVATDEGKIEVATDEENNEQYQEFKEDKEQEEETPEVEEPEETPEKTEEEVPETPEESEEEKEETPEEEEIKIDLDEQEKLIKKVDKLLEETPVTTEVEDYHINIDDLLEENNREFDRIRKENEDRKNQILKEIEESSAKAKEEIAKMGDRYLEKYASEKPGRISFDIDTADFSVTEVGEQIRKMLDAEQANEEYEREIEAKEEARARQEEENRQKEAELREKIQDRTLRAQEEARRLQERDEEVERAINAEEAKGDALDNLIGEVGGRRK